MNAKQVDCQETARRNEEVGSGPDGNSATSSRLLQIGLGALIVFWIGTLAMMAVAEPWGEVVWSENGAIWTSNLDGSEKRVLYEPDGGNATYPVISPGGTSLAFHVRDGKDFFDPETEFSICIMSAQGQIAEVETPLLTYDMEWDPSGEAVYYTRNQGDAQIGRVDIDEGVPYVSSEIVDVDAYRTLAIGVSDDGAQLALINDPSNWTYNAVIGTYSLGDQSFDLVIGADGSRNFSLDCSPTRPEIAFDQEAEPYSSGSHVWSASHIWIMQEDGTGLERLTEETGVAHVSPVFSQDGETIYYIRRIDDQTMELWCMDRNGGNKQMLFALDPDVQEHFDVYQFVQNVDSQKTQLEVRPPTAARIRIVSISQRENLVCLVIENGGGLPCQGVPSIVAGLSYDRTWVPEWETHFMETRLAGVFLAPGDRTTLEFQLANVPQWAFEALAQRKIEWWSAYEDRDPQTDYIGFILEIGDCSPAFAFLPVD